MILCQQHFIKDTFAPPKQSCTNVGLNRTTLSYGPNFCYLFLGCTICGETPDKPLTPRILDILVSSHCVIHLENVQWRTMKHGLTTIKLSPSRCCFTKLSYFTSWISFRISLWNWSRECSHGTQPRNHSSNGATQRPASAGHSWWTILRSPRVAPAKDWDGHRSGQGGPGTWVRPGPRANLVLGHRHWWHLF